jgi:hypothetical protein
MGLFDKIADTKGAPPAPAAGGFDRLGIVGSDGAVRWLTKSDFEGLPLVDRVRLLAGGSSAQFYRGGQQISPREAMRG